MPNGVDENLPALSYANHWKFSHFCHIELCMLGPLLPNSAQGRNLAESNEGDLWDLWVQVFGAGESRRV